MVSEERWEEIQNYVATQAKRFLANKNDRDDIAQTVMVHLFDIEVKHPKRHMTENPGLMYTIINNRMLDWIRTEKRRSCRLVSLADENTNSEERQTTHEMHRSLQQFFDDDSVTSFEDTEYLLHFLGLLRRKLTMTPRRLLDAIIELGTADHQALAIKIGVRGPDAVRANLSIIRRTAKMLYLQWFSN